MPYAWYPNVCRPPPLVLARFGPLWWLRPRLLASHAPHHDCTPLPHAMAGLRAVAVVHDGRRRAVTRGGSCRRVVFQAVSETACGVCCHAPLSRAGAQWPGSLPSPGGPSPYVRSCRPCRGTRHEAGMRRRRRGGSSRDGETLPAELACCRRVSECGPRRACLDHDSDSDAHSKYIVSIIELISHSPN